MCPVSIERNAPLHALNTFGIAARAARLVRISSEADVRAALAVPDIRYAPKFVLGGGSNLVLTGQVLPTVFKVEIAGMRVLGTEGDATLVEAGAGVRWHDFVHWTLQQCLPGLENMALIPGTVGAAPVQNIGAYGMEAAERLHSLDAIDLRSGKLFTLTAAGCAFGYRDSIFKRSGGMGLAGRALITRVRFALPRRWRPRLGYLDLEKRMEATGCRSPSAQQIFDWVVDIRRNKLPDPAQLGNAGSFFKNPSVSAEQCRDIIAREPQLVHYPMPGGSYKLAAGWLIDACGWRGKRIGRAGVYERQALVLVNHGGASGGEVMTLAKAIQTSVYERFGIRLEPEPVVL